jgi:hypothetical protein
MVGTDCQVRVKGDNQPCIDAIGDAWRFGEGQCEGANRIVISRSSIQPGCPTLEGNNPDVVTQVGMEEGNRLYIRLAEVHDPITPDPLQRYTLWVITFDFTHANAGPTPVDGSTCGGMDQPAELSFDFIESLELPGFAHLLNGCEQALLPGQSATWNGGLEICDFFHPSSTQSPCGPVPAKTSTWGRIKATYH